MQNNSILQVDTLKWGEKKKWILCGAGVDNKGNVFAGLYDRKSTFTAYEWNHEDEKSSNLAYDEVPVYKEVLDIYTGFRNIVVGQDRKVYMTLTNRVKNGKLRGTKNFQVICYDFEKGEVDLNRDARISSGLKVQVGKIREEFGLKANKRFDNYIITDLIELEDESVILLAQKYGMNTSNAAVVMDFPRRGRYEEYAEEIILFEFDPDGKIQKALVIPSYQRSTDLLDRTGFFYHLRINEESRQLEVITREAAGKKLRGPDRIFLRDIDLDKGTVSLRRMLYEGKRRDQFFLKAFTEWLNEDLVSFVVLEGIRGQAHLVTVNKAQEPEEEEE